MSERLYDIVHEIDNNGYKINFNNIEYSILFPNTNDNFRDIAGSDYFILENIYDDIDIRIEIGNYILNNVYFIREPINQLKIQLFLPLNIELKKINDKFISINNNEEKLSTISIDYLTDSIGNFSYSYSLELSRTQTSWEIIINFDEEWINSQNRTFPLMFKLSNNFSSLDYVTSSNIKSLAVSTDQVYRDTRPDSATQFYVSFYDDSQFKRSRAIYKGLPVCSTVPYAIGDISDLTKFDIDQWYNGVGNDVRNVYLQIIASKPLNSSQIITYDVYLPGTVDYLDQQAEYIDSLDGLPVYRGVFPIYKNKAPSYIDGIGYLNVYLKETRNNPLTSRIQITGVDNDSLTASLSLATSVIGYGMKNLSGIMDVHSLGIKMLDCIINIPVLSIGGSSVSALSSRIYVSGIPSTIGIQDWYDSKNMEMYGSFADGTQLKNKYDYTISDAPKFVKVSSKYDRSSAVLDDSGKVWCWGEADYCGIGSIGSEIISSPVKILGNQSFIEIRSRKSAIARNSSGELWGWGGYCLDFGYTTKISSPIKISGAYNFTIFDLKNSETIAQATDGVVYHWGYTENPDGTYTYISNTPVQDLTFNTHSFIQLAGGSKYSVGLKDNGEVWVSGNVYYDNNYHNISPAEKISGTHSFIQIDSGTTHIIALKADGSTWGWFSRGSGELGFQHIGETVTSANWSSPVLINSGLNISKISAGYPNSVFLSNNGDIYTVGGYNIYNPQLVWGLGGDLQVGYNDTTNISYVKVTGNKSWIEISSNFFSKNFAIDDNNTLYSWGNGGYILAQDKTGYGGKNSPGRVRFFEQDMWGGYESNTILDPYYNIGQIPVPKLLTRVYKEANTLPSGRVDIRLRPDINDLVSKDTNYLAAKMNEPSNFYLYYSQGTPWYGTYWVYYNYLVNAHLITPDNYTDFPYLYMMLNADSKIWSNFKQAGLFMKPLYKLATNVNKSLQYNFADGFEMEISYYVRQLTQTLSPFDSTYSLKNSYDWSETYIDIPSKIKAYIEINDILISGAKVVKNYISTTDTISNNINKTVIRFNIADCSGSLDLTGTGAQTYPVKVKILVSPAVRLYSGYINQNTTMYNKFISPQNSIEIMDIKINPYTKVEF